MTMPDSLEKLQYLCNIIPTLLEQIPDEAFCFKSSPTKWSKKEILGHLIDSATNNHQRFIRLQYENEPVISYDQNHWNELSNYNSLNIKHLIDFWAIYNRHLIELIKNIPEQNLGKLGTGTDGQKFPLYFYINDYVDHLEHHIKQLVIY